ncbi:hypothetical protein [Paraburkholderia nemoris]|uniref:hypothetical protein n=1 Tax=Paraburkholderia nemoris TaxID=2793076 RepID=UPI0038B97CE2
MKQQLTIDQLLTDDVEVALRKAHYTSKSCAPTCRPDRVIDLPLLLEANISVIDSASHNVVTVKWRKPGVDAENFDVSIGHESD